MKALKLALAISLAANIALPAMLWRMTLNNRSNLLMQHSTSVIFSASPQGYFMVNPPELRLSDDVRIAPAFFGPKLCWPGANVEEIRYQEQHFKPGFNDHWQVPPLQFKEMRLEVPGGDILPGSGPKGQIERGLYVNPPGKHAS